MRTVNGTSASTGSATFSVASRAQTVAVEGGAERGAVGVRDRGRAVPRLHQHGLVLIVGAAARGERVVVVPRLRQTHGHGARHVAAVHDQELEHVVEDGGVGALFVDDRQDRLEVGAEHRGIQVRFTGTDPVHVALQRVDLAVVDDVAIRVRALPRRCRVGGVARVDQRDGRLDGGVGQVDVEATHLRCDEHALVHDGACRERAGVEDLAVKGVFGLGGLLDRAAAHVEATLERIAARRIVGAADEGLQDGGHAGAGRRAQIVRVDGDFAPEEQRQAALSAAFLEQALCDLDAAFVLREEQHGDAVVAFVGQQVAAFLGLLAEEVVRHLEQDAGAVAGVALQARATTMLKVDENRQGVVNHLMRTDALEVSQRADAARVMLELRTIEPARSGYLP